MPRIARGLADGLIYHILNRGNGRQEVFHRLNDVMTQRLSYDVFLTLRRSDCILTLRRY